MGGINITLCVWPVVDTLLQFNMEPTGLIHSREQTALTPQGVTATLKPTSHNVIITQLFYWGQNKASVSHLKQIELDK